jgi:two-component system, cell cycle sensor histidine kinase DivJ
MRSGSASVGRARVGVVNVLAPFRDYLDSLVHPTGHADALTGARHRAFIAPRLLSGLTALALLPVQLATRGAPTPLEMVVFGWLIFPLLAVFYLSRTGRLDRAQGLCSMGLTALVTAVAAATGGLASNATLLLVIVPFEAAASAGRRPVAAASAMAGAALLLLLGLDRGNILPHLVPDDGASVSAALAVAILNATLLAVGSEWVAARSRDLINAEGARYHLLATNMTDVIVRHGPQGVVLFASPAAERLIGVEPSALRGRALFDRIHVADRPAYLTALSEVAVSGQPGSVEFRILQGPQGLGCGGRLIWVEMRSRPLEREVGPAAGERELVSVLRDVTDRKHQDQMLEHARVAAEHASAAKGLFLATMSHELRTPLNAIIGFSDMLLNETALNLKASCRHDYAQLINDSGHHLLSVVNGILDMSRLETGNFHIAPEPFALCPVIANCCELLALKANESEIDLVFRRPSQLPEIVADKRAVKQVLLNLLSNAIKFTRNGGRVMVSARAEDSSVVIVVEDTGVGIADADLPRLGDPFFQARSSYDRPHEGTGLGLSIVKGLIELHGGHMDISSRLGEGTRVTVRLPLHGELPGQNGAGAMPAHWTPIASLTHVADVRMKKRA